MALFQIRLIFFCFSNAALGEAVIYFPCSNAWRGHLQPTYSSPYTVRPFCVTGKAVNFSPFLTNQLPCLEVWVSPLQPSACSFFSVRTVGRAASEASTQVSFVESQRVFGRFFSGLLAGFSGVRCLPQSGMTMVLHGNLR